MPERRIVKLERLPVHGPGRDRWFIRPGSRSRPWVWFDSDKVPFIDAREAFFELERGPNGWRILRLVDAREHAPTGRDMSDGSPAQTSAWPRPPRTLGECRAASACRLFIGCSCGTGSHWERPDDHCRAFDHWTVEAMQRAGYWRCGCGRTPAAMIYDWASGMRLMVERWTLEGASLGWVRC